MKLLFVLDSVEYPLAPNPVLARRVAGLLAQRGHTVHLLELWDGETSPPPISGCKAFLLPFADEREMNRAVEFGRTGGVSAPVRLSRLLHRPAAVKAAIRQFVLRRPRRVSAARHEIERLDHAHHYDAAVAIAAPYAGSFALASAAFGGCKASWQMDPYAANQDYTAPGSWAKELELGRTMDRIFVPPTATDAFAAGMPLAEISSHMRVLDFPSLVPPSFPVGTSSNERLRCVFAGNLYRTLRTPHFALELFKALNEVNTDLVFVGGGWQHYPDDLLFPYRKILAERLIVTGPKSPVEATKALADADVLISLGNGVNEQVPSKLFEYLATGKPILHLAKLKDDPCLPYLEKWPLACIVWESEGTDPEVLTRVRTFLYEQGRQRLPLETAAYLYPENTPEYAAALLEQELNSAHS